MDPQGAGTVAQHLRAVLGLRRPRQEKERARAQYCGSFVVGFSKRPCDGGGSPRGRSDIGLAEFYLVRYDTQRSHRESKTCTDWRETVTHSCIDGKMHAKGYRGTWVAGVRTRAEDEDTGARPGRLLRSQR